jgi:hypothetical protein
VSQPVGEIKVRRGLKTYGGKGESLVKGVVVNLSAIALSVKPGGSIERVQILTSNNGTRFENWRLDDDLLLVRCQCAVANRSQRAEHLAGPRSRDAARGTFHRLARFGATRKC